MKPLIAVALGKLPVIGDTDRAGETMPRAKSSVTQSELTRFAKAARAADRNGMVIVKADGTKIFVFTDSVSDTDVEIDDIDAMIEKVPDP